MPNLVRTRVSILGLVALLAFGVLGCEAEEAAEPASPGSAGLTASAEAAATTVLAATAVVQSVAVRLTDFSVTAEPASVRSGAIAFLVRNDGAIPHEFVIVASDLAPSELPQKDQKAVDETVVGVLSRIDAFDSGTRRDAIVTLESGRYVLICNIPSHYISGMYAVFLAR